MIQVKSNLLKRFGKDQDGALAIEFAMVVPILAGMFLATVDLSGSGFTKSRLSSALRFSGQYVANGGTDLGVAESVFANSYGGAYSSFDTDVSCSCARSRASIEDGSGAQDQNSDQTTSVTVNLDELPQCSIDCGGDPEIRYVDFTATVVSKAILGSDRTLVETVSVRLK